MPRDTSGTGDRSHWDDKITHWANCYRCICRAKSPELVVTALATAKPCVQQRSKYPGENPTTVHCRKSALRRARATRTTAISGNGGGKFGEVQAIETANNRQKPNRGPNGFADHKATVEGVICRDDVQPLGDPDGTRQNKNDADDVYGYFHNNTLSLLFSISALNGCSITGIGFSAANHADWLFGLKARLQRDCGPEAFAGCWSYGA